MEQEVIRSQPLLDEEGHITEEGWARKPVWNYSREAVHAPWYRIKEWDYYYIYSKKEQAGFTVTISDLGYAGLLALCWIDFKNKQFAQTDTLIPLTRGKLGLAEGQRQDPITIGNKKLKFSYSRIDGLTEISAAAPEFILPGGRKGFNAKVSLRQRSMDESISIATSWKEKRTAFYLNEKRNCLMCSGSAEIGGGNEKNGVNGKSREKAKTDTRSRTCQFSEEHSMGGLDWGRGNWTYTNTWYWASASGCLNKVPLGINLGYGFSDRSPAGENALVLDGRIHKLGEVSFQYDAGNYLKPWKISSADNRLNLTFQPIFDRFSKFNFLLIKSVQHQVFGYFSGSAVLNNGEKIVIEELAGFAEDVFNRW